MTFTMSAAVAQDKDGDLSFVINPTDIEAKAIEEYWTVERMRNAHPLELQEVPDEDFNSLFVMPVPSQPGEVARTVEPSRDSTNKLTPEDNRPASLDQLKRVDVLTWSFNTGGRLFFHTPKGDRSCSAQFVGSGAIIMTAARCVMDGDTGTWHSHMIFVQRYDSGRGVKRRVYCGAVKNAWHSPNRLPYDYAFLRTVSSSKVWLGLEPNMPFNQFWAIGYPRNYKRAQHMYKLKGTKKTIRDGLVSMTANTLLDAIGGAWIGDTKFWSAGRYAIGLHSHYRLNPLRLFSPYFNDTTLELWKSVHDEKCTRIAY